MFNIGPGELVAILAVALIVLGPNRLPEAVRTVGRVVGELRRISSGFQDELRNALDDSDVIDPVEPTPTSNKGTELVDSSAAALVEQTASTATPAGSEDTVDDDLDDLDSPDQPVPGAADVGGPEPEPVGDADEPARRDKPVVLDMPADDAPSTGNGAGAAAGGDSSGGDDPDGRGSFDHIEALEALDPGRGAEAEIAGSAAADATESDNGADADDSRAAS